MHMHVQLKLDELQGPPNPWLTVTQGWAHVRQSAGMQQCHTDLSRQLKYTLHCVM
jgi:hypothetical protein